MGGPHDSLRVRLLGGLAVDGLGEAEIGSRKARLFLKVVVLARGAPVPAGTLADILWPDQLPARPADQLGVLASRLRRVVGAHRLTRTEAGYALDVDWLDLDELRRLTDDAARAVAEGRLGAARAAAQAAVTLARGPLLPDDDGTWIEAERAAAAAVVVRAQAVSATAALQAGDAVAAELAAETVLAHDPYDEAALRILMQAQVALGRPASALASYARFRARLADELGVSPSRETEALHTAVLTGDAGAPAPVRVPPLEIIGREAELATLESALDQATSQVRSVLVVGEAGIGKSTLVRTFVDRVAPRVTRTAIAGADQLGRNLPLQPLLDALGDGVGPLGSGAFAGTSTAMPDIPTDRARLFDSVLRALITGDGLTVLVVEDAHWADPTTLEWLAWVQHRPAPLLVVVTGRPGTQLPGAVPIALGPLDEHEIQRLISANDDPARAAAIHARSAGNPLFALAIASTPGDELPASVHDVVVDSLAHLDPEVVELARTLAVLDAVGDIDLIAGVLRKPATELIDRLEQLVAARLLVESGPGFQFRHTLVRDALSRSTGAARTALIHREAALQLSARPVSDPLAVALHARLGGVLDLAADAFLRAATISMERSDVVAAEEHVRASIEAEPSAAAYGALARVLMVAQRLDEAADEAERAIALGGGPHAFEIAGWVDYYRRRYDQAERFAEEAVERAAPASPLRASAQALAGRIRHGRGDPSGGEDRLTAALDGPPGVKALAEVWLGQVRVHQGQPSEALDVVEHALLDPEHIAHPFAQLHGRLCRIMALGQLGAVAAGLRAGDDMRAAIERAGAVGTRFRAVELNVRSWLLRGVGRYSEAEQLSLEAIECNGATDASGPRSEGFAEAYWVGFLDLADGHLAEGRHDQAAAIVASLAPIDLWDGTMAWHQRHRLGLVRARLARASGDADAAGDLALAVMADAEARGTGRYASLAHVQLALAGGDGDVARIERSVDVLRRCAALELPGLLDELAGRFGHLEWEREASERRAALSTDRR